MRNIARAACLGLGVALAPGTAAAQLSPSSEWAAHAANQYQVSPNIT